MHLSQAQQIITNIYISMNNTMLTALESAENMIRLAQDATKEGPFSPFINAGLEQLNIATVELAKAMKRVCSAALGIRGNLAKL